MEQIFLLFLGWLLSLAILRCWEGRVVCLLSILVYSFSQSVSLSVQPRAKPGRVTSSQSPPASALTSAEAARPGLASILREEEGGGGRRREEEGGGRWFWSLCNQHDQQLETGGFSGCSNSTACLLSFRKYRTFQSFDFMCWRVDWFLNRHF